MTNLVKWIGLAKNCNTTFIWGWKLQPILVIVLHLLLKLIQGAIMTNFVEQEVQVAVSVNEACTELTTGQLLPLRSKISSSWVGGSSRGACVVMTRWSFLSCWAVAVAPPVEWTGFEIRDTAGVRNIQEVCCGGGSLWVGSRKFGIDDCSCVGLPEYLHGSNLLRVWSQWYQTGALRCQW